MKKKRQKPRTKNLHQKKTNTDRISSLPDDILVTILSHLSIHQSIQTATLSRRWKSLWTLTTTVDFDSTPIISSSPNTHRPASVRCLQTLQSHRAPTLTRLRIRFAADPAPRDVCSWTQFLTWTDFAVTKSVQDLELDFKSESFRPHLLPVFPGFDSLKTLSLFRVDLKDSHVEYFCSHCPNLEALCMVGLGCVDLRICSESLLSLELSRCFKLWKLRVSASNLVSFTYWGSDREIFIEHAPLLSKVSFCESYCTYLANHEFEQFESLLPQLRTLKLKMSYPWIRVFPEIFGLFNLRNLELELKVWDCDHPLSLCASVLTALPFLHKFTLHLFKSEDEDYGNDDDDEKDDDDSTEDGTSLGLRVVEYLGFTGCRLDFQIIQILINKAVWLKKMTVVPSRCAWTDSDVDVMQLEEKEEARKHASLLGHLLSPRTKLLVL